MRNLSTNTEVEREREGGGEGGGGSIASWIIESSALHTGPVCCLEMA